MMYTEVGMVAWVEVFYGVDQIMKRYEIFLTEQVYALLNSQMADMFLSVLLLFL